MARAPDRTEQEVWNHVTGVTFGSWNKVASGLRERCQLNPVVILGFGLGLWLIGASMFWYIYRTQEVSKEQTLPITIFVWTLQFIAFYAVSVLVTGALMKR